MMPAPGYCGDRLPPEIARLFPEGEHLAIADLTIEQVRWIIVSAARELRRLRDHR